ncbi:MAG: hypothetical protein US94_C0015G0007 [Berkelbacteria bacterium GW2011_GWB1_38_5]|uniref:Uncharacterized protein n=1 Tax=Berkelbacteria bacterium GW2011_GWB1_38_5 TaxID=1618336 RepID=A0A0G0MK06_9BACT|nr:MAG: hypothetical protein US94_C0015G0007 [Berkelbacteria bacterium GW2011_GWB1_38_5]
MKNSKQVKVKGKIVKPNSFLETEKSHKNWYEIEVGMGKQRGKPRAVPSNVKKAKGEFKKHSHEGK